MSADVSPQSLVHLGSRIRKRRKALGITQRDLSSVTGIAQPELSIYEHGGYMPTLRNLMRLCAAFQCTPNDLLLTDP